MKRINAFTLAEAIAVLVLLGVVFAITVPSAISNAAVKSRRLKVKRAMTIYQQLVENMVVENDLPRNTYSFESFAKDSGGNSNCLQIRQYMKTAATIGSNGCKFLSVNDIYWDFTYGATKPIIAFNQEYLTKDLAEADDNNTTFMMSTKFSSDGGIRVNDLGYEQGLGKSDDYWHVAKMDCFINNKTCEKKNFIHNNDLEEEEEVEVEE